MPRFGPRKKNTFACWAEDEHGLVIAMLLQHTVEFVVKSFCEDEVVGVSATLDAIDKFGQPAGSEVFSKLCANSLVILEMHSGLYSLP